jgi:diketogulonate reductase-like aldo/keto reductase
MDPLDLIDGGPIPPVGLAAFVCDSVASTKQAILEQLAMGIRYFEIAELFCNGHTIRDALKDSGVPRSEIFISLKVWPKNKTPEALFESCKKLIETVQLGYIDLIMVHAPIDVENRFDQWKSLEQLKDLKLVNSLGVSNISLVQLMTILKDYDKSPSVLEMEVNPFSPQRDLVDFCQGGQIVVVSNEPLAKGLRNNNQTLRAIARKLETTVDMVLIRWVVTKGMVVMIPKDDRYVNNAIAADFVEPLEQEIMDELDAMDEDLKSAWKPSVEVEDE